MDASVIVPAYNSEKTISSCIGALLVQKTNNTFEIIVVDDGSTDSTPIIAKSFGQKIRYFRQKNSGPAKARNFGAKKARGKVILFTDSDCIPEKNWLDKMLAPFDDKEVAAVQGAYKTKQKGLVAIFGQLEIEHRYELMKKSKQLDWVGSYSAAYKKEIYKKMGGFDESFPIASGEDSELSYKIQESGQKIIFNPNAIVYHTHPEKLYKYLKVKFFRAYYRPKMYSKHKTKMVKDSYTPQTLKLQILCFYAAILGAIVIFISTFGIWIIIASIIGHLILGLEFFAFCLKKDKKVAILSPFILGLRSIVFGLGLIWGKLNG